MVSNKIKESIIRRMQKNKFTFSAPSKYYDRYMGSISLYSFADVLWLLECAGVKFKKEEWENMR